MKFCAKSFCVVFLFMLGSIFVVQAEVIAENADVNQEAGWTFLIYMESNDELLYWGLQNICEMALATKDKDVRILVQLHIKGNKAWRYAIDRGVVKIVAEADFGGDSVENVVDAMSWVVTGYPAKHYGLIFWNHGFGILDPVYVEDGDKYFPWQAESLQVEVECESGLCPIRGFMFDFEEKKYITNDMLISAMAKISQDVLGKKVDIIGTDCCKMAMLEVGYQIRHYADCLVGSQNCELPDGWNYKAMFDEITGATLLVSVARVIVDSYGDYCEEHSSNGLFTLSAFDLAHVDAIAANLNKICALSKAMMEKDFAFREAVLIARSRCVVICDAPYYTDLDSFYSELLVELEKMDINTTSESLVNALTEGCELINKAVIANSFGENMSRVRGISIYFPRRCIDKSYLNIPFAQETEWLSFLESVLGSLM